MANAKALRPAVRENDRLVKRTFRAYLSMSIVITLSATLGMMIDNVIAGNLLGPEAVAAIGMTLPLFMLFSGVAGILETGSIALSARALGGRAHERINVLFSIAVTFAAVLGVLAAALGFSNADVIARAFGAEGTLLANTTGYVSGIALAAPGIMLMQVLMGFARLDNAPQLGMVAIVTMSICDVAFNLVAVLVLNAGLFGMGCATAAAYLIAMLICASHLLSKKNTLRYVKFFGHMGEVGSILKTGLPDSLSRVCVMARTFIFNHLLLIVAGATAVTALSLLSSVNAFLSAVTVGVGQTATLLCGIFYGEEDRSALKSTLRVAMKYGLILSCIICVVVFVFAEQVVSLFGVTEGEAFGYSVVCVRAFAACVPIDLLNTLFVNYYQGTGNLKAADLVTVAQAFLFSTLFAACTVWTIGPWGVWLSFLVGETITLVLQVVIAVVLHRRRKRAAAGADQAGSVATTNSGALAAGDSPDGLLEMMMYLPADFQADWRATASFDCEATMDSVVTCSRDVADFCERAGIEPARTYRLSLAVEEMAGNIVRHGFAKTKHPAIEIRLIVKDDDRIILRLRDNGKQFNPLDYDLDAPDSFGCIGIRLIRRSIQHLDYQNTVGLNNLIVEVSPTT